MKKVIIALLLASSGYESMGQVALKGYPIAAVPINHVELTDKFWLPKIKTVQKTTIPFGFDKSYKEGRMDNFLIAGGKMKGKTRGAMPFDDTDVYKLIEGASNSLISSPDKKLEAYVDSIIAIINVGQEPDGYLTTWHTIDPNNPPAKWVKPGPRWESESMSHELYNAGHLYEAAATHYVATNKRNFLDIALKNADLLVKTFGPEPGKRKAPPGHQIVETGLIKLYNITQKEDYLKLAKFFLDVRGDSTTHKLYGPYSQDHKPVTQQDEVVGHAVRGVYMYAGMTDVAALYNDKTYLNAIKALWENTVNKKMYITGGIGSRHEGESFGDNYEIPNKTAYNETCASIGDVYWNQRLFMLTGESKYYDVIERTLYNGLISGISLSGDQFFYPNPLESDGEYKFNFGASTRQPWFDCSCCPTNLVRFVPSVPNLIYATQDDKLYVNLFASNRAQVMLNKLAVTIEQQTEYPWNGAIKIGVNPAKQASFTVKVRIPGWTQNEVLPGNLYSFTNHTTTPITLTVNGKAVQPTITNGYADITRSWKKGDVIELMLPMSIRRVVANEAVKDDKGLVSLEYGPVVYCVEGIDNQNKVADITLPDAAQLRIEKKDNLLGGVNVITGTVPLKGQAGNMLNLVAIPYYTWSNRGVDPMKVWLPRSE
ncbi:glycoside hydrolase family 127 protein [soil metagenome]